MTHRTCSALLRLLALAALASGCRTTPDPAGSSGAPLPEGVVASVSEESITATTVGRIASAQGLDVRAACDRAIADALFAAEARRRLDRGAMSRSIEAGTLARTLLEELVREARAEGPPTDKEIELLTRERWIDLDRPSMARTTHAVAWSKDPALKAQARALAARIAEAVSAATSSAEFKKLASAVPRGKIEMRAEHLAPTTADGRSFEPSDPARPPEQFDQVFARAANAIPEVGKHSPIVETAFGFHVIRLDERLPEKRMPLAERRSLLHEDVIARRAGLKQQQVLDRLRQSTRIEIDRGAVDLTTKLRVGE
jgi:hypothetical protein